MERIHDYAVNAHRQFVVEHLHAWLKRAKIDACLEDLRSWSRYKLLQYDKYPKGCYSPERLKKLHESNTITYGKSGNAVKKRTRSPCTGFYQIEPKAGKITRPQLTHQAI